MPSSASLTSWRLVTARVHVSLSPEELSTSPRSIATRVAFNSLFLKHTPELGGVPVAQVTPLSFSTPAHFVDASPYAHLVATAQLLVFAPSRGVQLVGKVTYVGPDHVGLSVFNSFHATLPIEPVKEFYAYGNNICDGEWTRKWRIVRRAVGFQEDVTVGRQLRFVVDAVKASHSGLFQILASLNEALRDANTGSRMTLGVLPREEEIPLQLETADGFPLDSHAQNGSTGDGLEEDTLPVHVMPVGKKSSASRAKSALSALQAPDGDVGVFGDALTPSVLPGDGNTSWMGWGDIEGGSGDKRAKKKEKRRKSVKFEDREKDAKGEPQHAVTDMDSVAPVLTQAFADTRAEKRARKKEKEERKRHKRENDIVIRVQGNANSSAEKSKKKKKKKRKSSQDGTKAVQLLFGMDSYNGGSEGEDKRRTGVHKVPHDIGGSEDTKEEQGLLIDEAHENGGHVRADIRQNEEQKVGGERTNRHGVSQGSEGASSVATRILTQGNPPMAEYKVKEEDALSAEEKESAAPAFKQKLPAGKVAYGGEASPERPKQKKVKRKREKLGVDPSSEERKHRKKKRKRKHEDQLA